MKIKISGDAKEIAAFVLAVQGQQSLDTSVNPQSLYEAIRDKDGETQ